MAGTGIGAAVARVEDKRFLTGAGRYTDDINRPGQAYALFVRSPHAHAEIAKISTEAVTAADGVVAVFTHADLAADEIGTLPCGWVVTGKNGEPHKAPAHPILAHGKVRHVGDPVAMIVAETYEQAQHAADLIAIDYKVLPVVVDPAETTDAGAPLLHEEAPGNICYDWELGDKAGVDTAFEAADHVVKLDLRNNRTAAVPIETRAAVAEYDRGADNSTLYTTTQNPHVCRLIMSAFLNLAPEHKLRIVSPDVGGGFGTKIFVYSEEAACLWAAKKVGRPVKWTATRSEAFISDAHGRDHVTTAELALAEDGKFLGLRVSTVANMGAYLSTFATSVPTYLYATLLSGQYVLPQIYCEVKAVFTNTVPVDAVRGAGRPEATFVVERLVETAARQLEIDPAEIRRKNFIPPDAFPYQTPVIMAYDSGNYGAAMDKALDAVAYDKFESRRVASRKNGKLRGIGFSAYVEACGIAPSAAVGSLGAGIGLWEAAQIRFNPTGNVTVFTGSHSQGQGHETTFAQIVADRLGLPFDMIEIVHGDTEKGPFGMGTYGSRSLAVGGSAIVKATDKIIAKGRKIAAHMLEAAQEDIEFADGAFRVAGTDRAMTMAEIAFAAYVPHNYPSDELEPGLDETAFYDPANFTFPAGCHLCEVEVEAETGRVEIVNWVAADDFGEIVNPMIVEGQICGGVVHGVGQALLENCRFDDSGQLVTGSLMDYALPRADDMSNIETIFLNTPCPHNPLGAKGCGEAGAIAAPAALVNAVTHAVGAEHIEMPLTAEKVWSALTKSNAA
ncbi:MAG: xanthine dehydrogenase family protein molybdopterin-binding subunit [Alphaproteobacteria bacterium]|nr:xanthine dehydrogenase family protein molybdopterin-binding subunit [Alphaproteobacteria bacterium]